MIEFLSVTEADCETVKTWMIQKYTGEDVASSEASKESTFFVELDID